MSLFWERKGTRVGEHHLFILVVGTNPNFITHGFQAAVSTTQALFFCEVSRVSSVQQLQNWATLRILQLSYIIAKVNSALHLKPAISMTRWREEEEGWDLVIIFKSPYLKGNCGYIPKQFLMETTEEYRWQSKLELGKKKSKNRTQSFLG